MVKAKTDVGCPVLGNREMGYLLTTLVEDGHAVARKIDIPTVVDGHSVRPHIGKHLSVGQQSVGQDVIFQDSIRLCLGHIQMFSVRSSHNAIGYTHPSH